MSTVHYQCKMPKKLCKAVFRHRESGIFELMKPENTTETEITSSIICLMLALAETVIYIYALGTLDMCLIPYQSIKLYLIFSN